MSVIVAACAGAEAEPPPASTTKSADATTTTSTMLASTTSTTAAVDAFARPEWLGTRVLDEGADGFGVVLPTPSELDPRRLRTPVALPDVPDGRFRSTVSGVTPEVLARSTWNPSCPVTAEELRLVTVTFLGFDGEHHTGELLVNAVVADDIVEVFREIHADRFPIEEMRITASEELALAPTGDGNNTSAFVCRPVRGGSRFSQHAYGLAIDVNPFHNPYVKGDLVLPELASTYVDRDDVRDGMLTPDSAAVAAFAGVGWEWGGAWDGQTVDHMHFSADGS